MSEIKSIHTPCKKCVFAEYNGQTQIDCELDYISKYRNKGIQILEVYDEEKEFYVINDKKCLGYRTNIWLEKNNITDKILAYKQAAYIDYIAIIDTKTISVADLKQIIEILDNNIKPKKIYIIRHSGNTDVKYEEIKPILSQLSYPWKLITDINDSDISYYINYIVSMNQDGRFTLVIKSKDDIDKIVQSAQNIVYDQLGNFSIIGNSYKNVYIFSNSVYKYTKFNNENLIDSLHYQII